MIRSDVVYAACICLGLLSVRCSGANVDRATIASGHLAESKDCQVALYSDRDIVKFNKCQDAVDTRFGIPPMTPKDGGL